MGRISGFFSSAASVAYGAIAYNLGDQGLAKTLSLETLTHGTNPLNSLKIRIHGGQPSKGGSLTGSTHNLHPDMSPEFLESTKGFFYLFKDSKFPVDSSSFNSHLYGLAVKTKNRETLPKFHAFLSSKNQLRAHFPRMDERLLNIFGVIGAILSPTLRFRFSSIDPQRLEDDEVYNRDFAYKTKEVVENWRIGPLGSLLTGVNTGWFSRAKDNPSKVLTGLAQLGAATTLALLGRSRFRGKLPFVLAGALLA